MLLFICNIHNLFMHMQRILNYIIQHEVIMALMGRCLIDIADKTRDRLKTLGAKVHSISYDVVINNLVGEHESAGLGEYKIEIHPIKK